MTEKKKKGLFSMLFGKRDSGCCDMKIEEVAEEEERETGKESRVRTVLSCCGTRPEESKHVKE